MEPATEQEVVAARANLASAEEKLSDVQAGATAAQLAAAQAALVAAEDKYEQMISGPDPEDVQEVKLRLDQAKNSLWSAQAQRDSVKGNRSSAQASIDSAEANVLNAEVSVQLAELAYQQAQTPATTAEVDSAAAEVQRTLEDLENLRASPTAGELAAAQAQVAQAQVQLEALLAEPDAGAVVAAEARVVQAQAQLDDLLAGVSPEDLEIAQLNVEHSRSNLSRAQAQLDNLLAGASAGDLEATQLDVQQALNNLVDAQRKLEDTVLRAPIGGTILAIEVQPGEAVGTASIIALADLETPQVLFWVEESDLLSVGTGNAVSIVFEALPDYTFPGEITHVDPALVTVDNTPAVQAWASIDVTVHPVVLISGMNAEVEIVAGEAVDALLVPVQALREITPGQQAVFVVSEDGELEMRMVEVGLVDFVNAEVLSGLRLGEEVSLGTTTTAATSGGASSSAVAPPAGGFGALGGGVK